MWQTLVRGISYPFRKMYEYLDAVAGEQLFMSRTSENIAEEESKKRTRPHMPGIGMDETGL